MTGMVAIVPGHAAATVDALKVPMRARVLDPQGIVDVTGPLFAKTFTSVMR